MNKCQISTAVQGAQQPSLLSGSFCGFISLMALL